MPREFRLPDIGEGLTEAEIVRWLVQEGDDVQVDQSIVEVETDKAVVEIPSPYAGVVLSHGGSEGDVIAVGEVLVTIGEPGEGAPTPDSETADDEEIDLSEPEPIVGTLSREAETVVSQSPRETSATTAVKALPVVRKLAKDNDVDLTEIEGSGPGGRILREDVEAVLAAREEPAVAQVSTEQEKQAVAEPTPEPRAPSQDERQPMSRLRRTIAANMARSWSEIPHVTTFDDVDATRLIEVRRALSDRHETKVPVEALVVKAVIPALGEHPEFNASLEGDDLVVHSAKDVGIAVDTPDGLMVAVIKDADEKSVMELAGEVRRLGEGARERSLGPGELSGQTFTVSNIGAVGGGHGTPIVPYGTVAILSVGQAVPRPVVRDDELAIAPVMPLSLSYDHRVIDGAVGRRFMALVIENLEEPALFLAG